MKPRKQKNTSATSKIQKKTLLHPSPWLRSTAAICLLSSYCSAANGSSPTALPLRCTRYSLPQCVHARYSTRGITVNRVPHAGQAILTASTSTLHYTMATCKRPLLRKRPLKCHQNAAGVLVALLALLLPLACYMNV